MLSCSRHAVQSGACVRGVQVLPRHARQRHAVAKGEGEAAAVHSGVAEPIPQVRDGSMRHVLCLMITHAVVHVRAGAI